jgi:hypothetical protein
VILPRPFFRPLSDQASGTTEALRLPLSCTILLLPSHLLERKIGFGSYSALATPTLSSPSLATSMTCNQPSARWSLKRLKHTQKKMVQFSSYSPLFVILQLCSLYLALLVIIAFINLQALWPWKLQPRQPTTSMICLLQLVIL